MNRPLTEKEELRLELNEVENENSRLRKECDKLRVQLVSITAERDRAVKLVREYKEEFGGRDLVLHDGYVPNVDGKDCEQLMDMAHAAEAILTNIDAEGSGNGPSLPPGWVWKTSQDFSGETCEHPVRTNDGKEALTYMGAWEIHRMEGEGKLR